MKKPISSLAVLLILLFSVSAQAQNFLSQRVPTEGNSSLGLRYFRYLPPSGSNLQQSFINGVYDLNATIHLNDGWILGGSIPVIYFGSGDMSESGLGNIEIKGAKLLGLEQNSMLSLSVYLPTAPNNSEAPVYGIFTHIYEVVKYNPDQLTFKLNYTYEVTQMDNVIAGIELGPQVWVPTNSVGFFDVDTEVIINYNIKLGYKLQDIALFGELGSWTVITEDGSFGDNSLHQFNVGLQLLNTPVQPGIFWTQVLDRDFFDGSALGLKVDFTF